MIADGTQRVPIIYGLVDPREPNRIRYVGQTVSYPESRLAAHVRGGFANRRDGWVRAMFADGVSPVMVQLERVATAAELDAREGWWIVELRSRGEADINHTLPKGVTAAAATLQRAFSLAPRQHHAQRAGGCLALLVALALGVTACGPPHPYPGRLSIIGPARAGAFAVWRVPEAELVLWQDSAAGVSCQQQGSHPPVCQSRAPKVQP